MRVFDGGRVNLKAPTIVFFEGRNRHFTSAPVALPLNGAPPRVCPDTSHTSSIPGGRRQKRNGRAMPKCMTGAILPIQPVARDRGHAHARGHRSWTGHPTGCGAADGLTARPRRGQRGHARLTEPPVHGHSGNGVGRHPAPPPTPHSTDCTARLETLGRSQASATSWYLPIGLVGRTMRALERQPTSPPPPPQKKHDKVCTITSLPLSENTRTHPDGHTPPWERATQNMEQSRLLGTQQGCCTIKKKAKHKKPECLAESATTAPPPGQNGQRRATKKGDSEQRGGHAHGLQWPPHTARTRTRASLVDRGGEGAPPRTHTYQNIRRSGVAPTVTAGTNDGNRMQCRHDLPTTAAVLVHHRLIDRLCQWRERQPPCMGRAVPTLPPATSTNSRPSPLYTISTAAAYHHANNRQHDGDATSTTLPTPNGRRDGTAPPVPP